VFFADDWMQVIFNPSFPYRFMHMMTACFLTSAFLIAGVSAWRARLGVDGPATLMVMKTGVLMAAVLTPLQIFIGDLHGLNTLQHQPAKIAAMEAVWTTERGAAFTLIGLPDEETRSTRYAIKIPYAASLILTHSADGEVKGLNEYEGQHPPVAMVFWSFRVMLGMGMLMLLVSWWTALQFHARQGARAVAVAGAVRDDLLRLGRHARRLVRHRDRPATVDHLRPGDLGGSRGRSRQRNAYRHPARLPGFVRLPADLLHPGAALPGLEAGAVALSVA
jgi:cytochrome bd-type quinol oxidase subunit 1